MMRAESLSNLSLDGKVAVVTGSTQGLGEAIAHVFASVKAALEAKGTKRRPKRPGPAVISAQRNLA